MVFLFAGFLTGEPSSKGAQCTPFVLQPKQQKMLDRYLIVEASDGRLLLSPKLGYSCEMRQRISLWLSYSIGSHPRPEDARFAINHRAILNRVVLMVWPAIATTPAVPEDGDLSSDKWNILDDAIIDDNTVTKLVLGDILRRGLWGESAHLIFSRSLPGTHHLIRPILIDPHSDIIEKLYAFALLTRMKPVVPIPSIETITQNVALTDAQKRTVDLLRNRIQAGQPAEWSDVDGLLEDEI